MAIVAQLGRAACLAVIALLVMMPVLTAWNMVFPNVAFSLGRKLADNAARRPLAPNLDSFFDGTTQRAISKLVATDAPVSPFLVRLSNELEFDLFGQTQDDELVLGRDRTLVERKYIKEYCQRSLPMLLPKLRGWARTLHKMEEYYATQGKIFLYVISPSKAAAFPELFVDAATCPGYAAGGARLLPLYDEILTAAGVNFVDAARLVAASQGSAENPPLWPKGGAHWTDLAAVLATQAIIENLNHRKSQRLLPRLSWTYTISKTGIHSDWDLFSLLNILRQKWPDRSPQLTVRPETPCATKIPEISVVGGSFLYSIIDMLMQTDCVTQVRNYYYLVLSRVVYPPSMPTKIDLTIDDIAPLRQAKIVIFEENESVIGRSIQGPKFARLLLCAEPDRGSVTSGFEPPLCSPESGSSQ